LKRLHRSRIARVLLILPPLLLALPLPGWGRSGGYELGAAATVHTYPGNLRHSGVNCDLQLFFQRRDTVGGMWRLAIGYYQPQIPDPLLTPPYENVAVWLLRGGEFTVWGYHPVLFAGAGWVDNIRWKSYGKAHIGSLGFDSGMDVPFFTIGNWMLIGRFSYIGTVIPGTYLWGDRFGLGIGLINLF